VGVVSAHLCRHHGALWVLGWLEDLAGRDSYEIFCYHTGATTDQATKAFERISTFRRLPVGPDTLLDAATTIRGDAIDLLLFPDIGMEATTRILSLLRLAPVQVQGWGHPVTSGSPCMDAFLVGEGMETPQGQRNYTEVLHLLPRTGLNEPFPAEEAINEDVVRTLGLPGDRPLLLSLQSSFKYAPRNDGVLVAIAQQSRDALILMVDPPLGSTVGRMLHQRLRARFAQAGLEIEDHLRLLPRLDFGDVLGLFRIGHHALDTIDWNGGNTSLQALSQGCPIVTLPTSQMRGRHTIAMLEVLELPELIARDREDYVAISLRLLRDEAYHARLRETILERRHLLFDDEEVSRAFRSFVDRCVPRTPLPMSGP
jgi:predicted O-linked N-acetylglucosamine transferase (SPINDLY family)